MKYEIELSEELVDFFQSALAVLDLKYPNPESMLKHILLVIALSIAIHI